MPASSSTAGIDLQAFASAPYGAFGNHVRKTVDPFWGMNAVEGSFDVDVRVVTESYETFEVRDAEDDQAAREMAREHYCEWGRVKEFEILEVRPVYEERT